MQSPGADVEPDPGDDPRADVEPSPEGRCGASRCETARGVGSGREWNGVNRYLQAMLPSSTTVDALMFAAPNLDGRYVRFALCCVALRCAAFLCVALPCSALRCVSLCCVAFLCVALVRVCALYMRARAHACVRVCVHVCARALHDSEFCVAARTSSQPTLLVITY